MGGSRVIRVTNIAPQATRDQMQTLFQFVGKVEEIKLYPTIRDVAIPVASRVSFVKFFDRDHVGIAQHLNNTVFIDRALIIVPYEKSDIPDEHSAMQALVQSNGVLGVTNEQQLPAHVTNIVDGAYYITSDPTFAERGLPEYPSLTCTLEYGQVEEIRRTVMVGNLAPSTDAAKVMEWIGDAGEIKYARMCGRDTDDSRACLIEFSEQASVIPALLKSGQKMGDRALVVGHASLGIAKPQIKTNEMAQREIEEAMRRAQEQQSLINSTMQPVTSYMDETRRSRSRDRSARRRRSRSRDRRRGGRSRSRSPRRSRSRYSPARDRRRSRSRDRKSRSRRSRSRSRDRSRRSRHRTRSRSRDRKKDDKDRRGGSRDKDRKDKDKDKDRDKDRSRSDKDKDRSRDKDKEKSSRSKDEGSHAKESRKTDSPAKEKSSKESSSRARSRSRSPAKKRSRSRSSDRRRGGRGGGRSSPSKRRSRSRSKDRRASKRVSRSPAPVRKRSRSPPPRASHSSRSARSPEPKRRDRDRDHKRDKSDRREKDSSKSEKSDAKISRDYDEEEKGFDEDSKKSPSRDASPAGKRSREDRSAPAGADDMDISD